MARPPRIEFPGAVYHLSAWSLMPQRAFIDDDDRHGFLQLLGMAAADGDAVVLAWCLADDHYHLVLQTRRANLSAVMRQIGGIYTQRFNRRHARRGRLFQGRFDAVLVDADAWLLEVCRDVELSASAAGDVAQALLWPWSSLHEHLGLRVAQGWLDQRLLHAGILGREPSGARDAATARKRWRTWLAAGRNAALWADGVVQRGLLGDAAFVRRTQTQLRRSRGRSATNPETRPASRLASLETWLGRCGTREEAFVRAYREGGMTMTSIAKAAGLSVARVSQLVRAATGDNPVL